MIKKSSSNLSSSKKEVSLDRIAEIYRGIGEKNMPKGYWIVHIEIRDKKGYEEYKKASAAHLSKFGAKFLVRGGSQEKLEGSCKSRTVLIEFPDFRAAQLCYKSQEYQKAQALRKQYSVADLVIVEGTNQQVI